MDIKFTQTGKYVIAAGSERPDGQELFSPVLYISAIGEKSWATHYPLDGKFTKDDDASAAALDYGIQITSHQVDGTPAP